MQDGVRGRASGRVADDGGEEGLVDLRLVEAAHEEDDRLADALQPAVVAEEVRQPVHEARRGQELAHAQEVCDPLRKRVRYFESGCGYF